ncbi:MAG: cation:proton antiporter [Bacteroidaceae bacterium]|nr:cation:proton antiporter [Bacteroidaceae bacterium]
MVQDLCVIMLTAGVTSLLFKLLKQPVVLGYIVAGMLVGPYVLGEAWVTDVKSVDTWGQIGVLFLLFALGLEFSFKKLLQVGSTAIIAAGTIVVGMMALGFLVGRLFGWTEMNALFLGGMLCMSSTTIVFKALDDMGLRNHQFARICFGILVVEDLFAVVLMVLLSSIATSRSFEGKALLLEVGKLIGYLVIWFVVGIAVLPTFLRKFKKLLNNETLIIFVVGLCLGMVLLAVGAGFSSALGAFVMGSLMAETLEAERIERLMEPVKNIFGSIFFVSVGMMINPAMLIDYWLPILGITLVVIFGQILFASFGTLLSGQSLKVSLQTGFSLVQIGEFAFIIAALGQSLGVTDSSLYPIVVAVSVITTFLTPFVMRGADPTFRFVDSHLSQGTRLFLENYSRNRNTVTQQSTFQRLFRKTLVAIFVYGILIVFIYLLFFRVINPWLEEVLPNVVPDWLVEGVELTLLLLISSPFIYAIAHGGRTKDAYELWHSGSFQKAQLIALYLLRIVVSVNIVAYAIYRIFSFTSGVVAAVAILLVFIMMMSRSVRRNAHSMTQRFTGNLTAREKSAEQRRAVSRRFEGSLLSYDVHISDFELDPNSAFCGRSLMQLNIRERSGVSVVRIVRGGININIPGGRTVLYPSDKIVVAGSDEQIARFSQMIEGSRQVRKKGDAQTRTHVTLERFVVTPDNQLIGTTLMQSGIREQAQCIVMGIERDSRLITNPDPALQFQEGDVVLVAGETERIKQFVLSMTPVSS